VNNIIILGGSKLQLDLIFEAKKLYFKIHLFDGNPNCIGKQYVDYFYHIDIKDKATILEKAKELDPVAILTIATEVGNTTSCYVSEQLGLNSNSYQVSLNTTNKKSMKQICTKNDIQTAPYQILSNNCELQDWKKFPAIIKPLDSSAGRGVSFIEKVEDVQEAIRTAFRFSNTNEVIIEQYIKGKQYSIETMSANKIHKIVTITEEYITPLPNIIETQQLIPARVDEKQQEKIEIFALKILKSFEITYGASHIEIREDKDGQLYFIEIASRMGGWRSELISLALGINYCQLLLFSVLGKKIDFQPSRADTAIVKMILSQDNFQEYQNYQKKYPSNLISDLELKDIKISQHLADSNGFYYIHIQDKNQLSHFIGEHK
jgi:biotin carboxylase